MSLCLEKIDITFYKCEIHSLKLLTFVKISGIIIVNTESMLLANSGLSRMYSKN